jgi:hypothetical protein
MNICEEKVRLTGEYNAATDAFSRRVAELLERIGISPKEEYERLQHISEEWRVHSEQARLALEQHIAAHRCQVRTEEGRCRLPDLQAAMAPPVDIWFSVPGPCCTEMVEFNSPQFYLNCLYDPDVTSPGSLEELTIR